MRQTTPWRGGVEARALMTDTTGGMGIRMSRTPKAGLQPPARDETLGQFQELAIGVIEMAVRDVLKGDHDAREFLFGEDQERQMDRGFWFNTILGIEPDAVQERVRRMLQERGEA